MERDRSSERASSAAPVRIPLYARSGEVVAHALVDEVDAGQGAHRWYRNAAGYAVRQVPGEGRLPSGRRRQRAVFLHREVLGLGFGDSMQGDHMNRDRLDNRRANLRRVTVAEQRQNRRPAGGSSAYRGVSFRPDKKSRPWHAYGTVGRKRHHVGFFATEEEAAAAALAWRREHLPLAVD